MTFDIIDKQEELSTFEQINTTLKWIPLREQDDYDQQNYADWVEANVELINSQMRGRPLTETFVREIWDKFVEFLMNAINNELIDNVSLSPRTDLTRELTFRAIITKDGRRSYRNPIGLSISFNPR